MQLFRELPHCILLLCFLFTSLPAAAAPMAPLATPPLGERWFIVTMGDERTGFVRTSIRAEPEGYRVASDSSSRMVVLGFSREATSRESYLVNGDLSLKSFDVEQTIGGTPSRLHGEVTAMGVKVTVESAGKRREKLLKARGKVYPPAVLNLYPLMRGIAAGKKYRLQMLDPEEVKLKEVTVTVLGRETLPGGVQTVHLRNDLYSFVDNDIWVDLAGNTVRESVRDGLIMTSAADAATAGKFILDAAVARKELILDYSRVRVDRPIARPLELKRLAVELSGVPDDVPLPSGGGQSVARAGGGRVLVTVEKAPLPRKGAPSAADIAEHGRYLGPVGGTASESGQLIAKKDEILRGENDPAKNVERLASWVAAHVAEGAADNRSPLATLGALKGDSWSRALLYVALARAAGIPSRVVVGLVYVAGKGFLFHSWAESLVGEWLAVDPSSGQLPADATHVRLAEGESAAEMPALARLVGRLAAKVVEESY